DRRQGTAAAHRRPVLLLRREALYLAELRARGTTARQRRRACANGVLLAPATLFDQGYRLELAETAGRAGDGGRVLKHGDLVETAILVEAGLVDEPLLVAEPGAGRGQLVAIDLAARHDEVDHLVTAHHGV